MIHDAMRFKHVESLEIFYLWLKCARVLDCFVFG